MQVRPIPGEAERFFVTSRSRPEVDHIVDVAWTECPGDMPRPQCSCERGQAHNEVCAHIKAVLNYLHEAP